MPIMFNSILRDIGLSASDVRLLRHQDNDSDKGRKPFDLWRNDRTAFEQYQAVQKISNRTKLRAKYWASFVGLPDIRTLFVGLYRVEHKGPITEETRAINTNIVYEAGSRDAYSVTPLEELSDFVGKLFVSWGIAAHAWIQRAENNDKQISELLKEFKEPDFPGLLSFAASLSEINNELLPRSWIQVLATARGVYLLTCPRTREQYVGMANGESGFWGRWCCHAQAGYGDAVKLKSREPSDYRVSILEVAGSSSTEAEVREMEACWKKKLQSREMGLNAN